MNLLRRSLTVMLLLVLPLSAIADYIPGLLPCCGPTIGEKLMNIMLTLLPFYLLLVVPAVTRTICCMSELQRPVVFGVPLAQLLLSTLLIWVVATVTDAPIIYLTLPVAWLTLFLMKND